MFQPLTDRQYDILCFVRDQQAQSGSTPSLGEIGKRFKIQSAAAAQHLRAIEKKGHIKRKPGARRAIQIVSVPDPKALLSRGLPLLGRIAAGQPLLATDHVEEWLECGRQLFHPQPDFLMRVQGDSMIDIGIRSGDLVGVRQQELANPGQIVAALILDTVTGEYGITLKRLRATDDGYQLLAENNALNMSPIQFSVEDLIDPSAPLRIAGIYCGHIHSGRNGSV